MRKLLIATSALTFLGAGAGFAQDFEPTNMNDEPTPDIVDTDNRFDPEITTGSTAAGAQPFNWVNRGFQAADGFRPSDQNDLQAPDFAAERNVFDEGIAVVDMAPSSPVMPLDQGVPGTAGFEPSDQNDEQAPDIAESQGVFDEGATVARAGVDTSVTTASVQGSYGNVPAGAVRYVEANPVQPVTLEGRVSAGMTLPDTISLRPVPDHPQFAYVYLDEGPALVDTNTRTVVWVR